MQVPDENLDLLKRIDTSLLYPRYLELINELVNRCAARGAYYVATSGTRTEKEQEALYAQGRTKPGKIVTNAKPLYSAHNFGCSIDFAPHVGKWEGKLNPDYSAKNYKILGEEARKLGLDWGGDWTSIKDTPHVQLNLKKHGITWAKLRQVYAKGQLPAVWKFLDQFQW